LPPDIKKQVTVKVDIRPGPASPLARASFAKFWRRLITSVKSEDRNDYDTA